MKARFPKFLTSTIRKQLSISFAVITLVAILSAATAWLLMDRSDQQSRRLINSTIPLVSGSQTLSREISFFTTVSKDLSKLTSAQQFKEIDRVLTDRINGMYFQLELLQTLGLEQEELSDMKEEVNKLDENLQSQRLLVTGFLKTQEHLEQALTELEANHAAFQTTTGPRIADNYRNFVLQGKDVASQIQEALRDPGSTSQAHNNSIRVGIATLVNTVAGELRSNHEIIAATFEATGLMYEAASVDSSERVELLREMFEELLPIIRRLQLILAYTPPENSRVLLEAIPIFNSGSGDSSIFSLRQKELALRARVNQLTDDSLVSTTSLANLARQLSQTQGQAAEEELESLNKLRQKAQFLQILAGITVLLVAIVIGWFYVGNRVVSRIERLKVAMNRHAQGLESEIPLDGDDEITDMSRALLSFVTQRAKVERRLQQNLELLNEAQQIAKFGSCIRQGESNWEWSDGFYSLIGYERDKLGSSEQNFWSLIHEQDREKVRAAIGGFQGGRELRKLEFRLLRADGTNCSVATRWKYSTGTTEQSGLLHGTLLDISERKLIEAELSKVQKLEAIGVLAGGIAHDFNNLLTAILGNISLLESEIPDNPDAREFLEYAESATLRARDLTSRLLTFSKGGQPVKSIADLGEVLKEAVGFTLHGSNVKCVWDIHDELWPVNIDPTQMNQVLQNLVLNADQAMESGGTLRVSSKNVTISEYEEKLHLAAGSYVKVEIMDHGCGIAAENIKKIFDPYFTTKEMDSTKGSGLGLAIVHSIVQKHDGHIEVQSAPGKGSTFTLYLPATPGAVAPKRKKSGEVEAGGGTILVMDDEEFVRSVAGSMLRKIGFEVLLTTDGQEAVSLYETLAGQGKKPDLVLLDLTVPGGMGGRKAAELILQLDPMARIIVSSGYSNEETLLNYHDYGFSGVASKPYDLSELAHVISEVMR